MKIGITGASGFIGGHLIRAINLRKGWSAVGFTRSPQRTITDCVDTRGIGGDADLGGLDAVVNLAGKSVFTRWTPETRKKLVTSRVETTRNVVKGIARLPAGERPRVLVSASGVGYYGDRGDEVLDDSAAPGDDFMANMAKVWEAEAVKAEDLGVRVVLARMGVVLGEDGGAFAIMKLPFSLGLGGKLGSGRQYMSWIHIQDLIALYLHAIEAESLSGPINAVGAEPVTNGDFTRALGAALHRPTIFPVPGFALKLAMGEASTMLLGSQRTVPARALASGFHFKYPTARQALRELAG